MKILHVNADLARITGGPSKTVIDMAMSALPFGHDISIYATDAGGETVALDKARAAGVDIRLFPVRFPKFWRRSPELRRALLAAIPSCDLVVIHSLYLYHSWAAASICHRFNVPYVVRPHGTLDPYLHRRHRWRKLIVEFLFQNRVLRRAKTIHYTSEDERLLAQPVTHNTSAEIVPLGLDENEYRPLPPRGEFRASYPEIANRIVVLFLGRLNFKKGLDLLLPAFAQSLKQGCDLHLVLAGQQDDDLRDKLAAMVAFHQLEGRVTFTGFIAGRKKLAALADADIFVLPSYSENFAVSVAEAMFCQLPVIVTDRVNICGDVANANAGRVIAPDAEELTAAIIELAGDEALRKRMGLAGEALVRERFLHEQVGQTLDKMYRRHARPSAVMKLLHVNADLARITGGPAKTVIDMSMAALPFGHNVSIYATDFGGETMSLAEARSAGVDIRIFPVGLPEAWKRSRALGRALNEIIPSCDLVTIHSLYLYHSWIAARICQRNQVPYIVCPHGALDPFLHRRHRWRKFVVEVLFQNRVLKNAAAIHYTSREERRLAAPAAYNSSAEIIPLSLNESEYRPLPPRGEFRAAFPEIGNRGIVLFLGRLNFKKGLDILLPAFAQAVKQGCDLHLVLAGIQDEEMRPKIAAMIAAHNLEDRVTIPGYIGGRNKLAALADADMFVLPSYSENFAVSVIEAMFCRVPVIVSDRVNICDDIAEAKAGRVIAPNVEEMTAAIVELSADSDLRRSLGSAGESLVRKKFLHEQVGRMLDQMYRRHGRFAQK